MGFYHILAWRVHVNVTRIMFLSFHFFVPISYIQSLVKMAQ